MLERDIFIEKYPILTMISTFTDLVCEHIITKSDNRELEKIREEHRKDLYKNCFGYYYATGEEKVEIIINILEMLVDYGVPIDIQLMKNVQKAESLMPIIDRRCHFEHSFNVMLMGLHIIDWIGPHLLVKNHTCQSFGIELNEDQRQAIGALYEKDLNNPDNLIKPIKEILNPQIGFIIRTWICISISHDFGFAYQESKRLLNLLSELYRNLDMDSLGKELDNLYNTHTLASEKIIMSHTSEADGKNATERVDEIIKNYLKSCDHLTNEHIANILSLISGTDIAHIDHGFVSSIYYYKCIDGFEFPVSECFIDDGLVQAMLKLGVPAIALHNLKYKPTQTNVPIGLFRLENNFYAYLLYLMDNIQDWGRMNYDKDIYATIYPVGMLNQDDGKGNMHYSLLFAATAKDWDVSYKELSSFLDLKENSFRLLANCLWFPKVTICYEWGSVLQPSVHGDITGRDISAC